MDDRLKHRLVGAIVLVALAVIFIPMILDGGREKALSPFGQAIPDKPEALKNLEAAQPQQVEMPPPPAMIERQLVDKHTATIKPEVTAQMQDKTAAVSNGSEKLITQTAQKGVKAWVVQVGSFESRKNALALRDKLRKSNYRAFVEAVKTNGSWNYRVRIGPEVRRSSAEAMQKSLLAKLKINGVVMGHP